jgi:hypothetical protein
MTSERLYSLLQFLDSIDKRLGIQNSLESVRDALSALANQPAQPTLQNNLATALGQFASAAIKLSDAITPSETSAIREIGGGEFFDPAISEKVTNSVQTNAMTPSVPRDFVADLAARRSTFLATVRSTLKGLKELGITDSGLAVGTADIAFLIPRDLFDNKLQSFAKELSFISRLVQDFTEAQTGQAKPVVLEALSSSVPTVALAADLAVLALLGTVVNKFLAAWEKIEKIRKVRAELASMGLKGVALEQLTDQITTTVNEVVEESTELVLANYKDNKNRKNELANSIRQDTRRLFGQVERGLTVEFRTGPEPDAATENQETLRQIANTAKQLKFPEVSAEPLLLEAGKVIDDDADVQIVHRTTKKTTTQTTTSKKAGPKEGTQESN